MTGSATGGGGEWTFARVLQLMDQEGRTGVLEVGSGDDTTRIHLRKGYVVGVSEKVGRGGWLLADYLVHSGTVSAEALVGARRDAEKRRMDIEEVLVERKLVSEDILKRFVDQQHAELLFPLFRRQGLAIRFIEERPVQSRFATALPVSYVLKQAEREAAEWPALRQRVGLPESVYRKDGSVMAELLGYTEPDEDASEPLPELGPNTRIVYFYVNGAKTVEQVARASGLTLYETYKAMNELLDSYLLTLVTTHGEGERAIGGGSPMARAVTVLTYLLLAGILAAGAQWASTHMSSLGVTATSSSPAIDGVVAEARLHTTHEAISLFHLHLGALPEPLDLLVDARYLRRSDAAVFDLLDYAPSGDVYTLRWRSAPP